MSSDTGEGSSAEASNPPEKAAMNECIVGEKAEELKPLVVREESVELVRKVRALMPPVRDDLVNELRAGIKDGSYDPSSEAIAAKILESRLDERQK
jgi:anti-sigma28 factor (negative regulator of flagellin synthesis)